MAFDDCSSVIKDSVRWTHRTHIRCLVAFLGLHLSPTALSALWIYHPVTLSLEGKSHQKQLAVHALMGSISGCSRQAQTMYTALRKAPRGTAALLMGMMGQSSRGTPSSLELWTSLVKTRPSPSPYSDFIKRSIQGCRDGLAVNGLHCSYRRPEFVSLASMTADSQLPVTPAPEHVTPSCGLC